MRRRRRENPETGITNQIREMLRLMRIPHEKHWGGPMSPKGIPDILATLPGETATVREGIVIHTHPPGRALWIEIKVPGKNLRPEQEEFLDKMREAGALAFVAYGPKDVLRHLSGAGFAPAQRITMQFPSQ